MVEVVYIVHRVASLQDVDFLHVHHTAQVYANPVVLFLAYSRGIERGRVIVEHQFGERGAGIPERADSLIHLRFIANHLDEESFTHIIHDVVIERLQLHRARFMCLVGGTSFRRHEVLHILVPEFGIVLAFAVDAAQFDGTFATCTQFVELIQPRLQFFQQFCVGASLFDGSRCFLYAVELIP